MQRVVDVDRLVAPLSADNGGGPDLEYDPDFRDLERAAAGRAEQQVGDTIMPGQEPDWRDVRRRAQELLGRTKDLRVAVLLTRALVRTDGFAGLADGLAVLRGLVESRWDDVHPRLDPDDGNDPTMRVNILLGLCDADALLGAVRVTPLVEAPSLGRLSLREHAIAAGEVPPPAAMAEDKIPTPARFDAAFLDAPLEQITATAGALKDALDGLKGLEASLADKVGAAHAASFTPLQKMIWQASRVVMPRLESRLASESQPADGAPDANASSGSTNGSHGHAAGGAPRGTSVALGGDLRSRADVERVLDKICEYYDRNEPSSPVPVLIKRARRLVSMNFEDIVKNLVPDGMNQLQQIRGPEDES